MQEVTNPFSAWENFYVIVGSAGGALTGLQFVVIALLTELRKKRTLDQLDAFATPTIVHFCLALLTAAVLSAPWRTLRGPALSVAAVGLGGLFYEAIVIRRARRQRDYKPVFEDWLWHIILPFVAYFLVLACALFFGRGEAWELFAVAAATVLLVCIGIHNAWDTVTWLTISAIKNDAPAAKPPQPTHFKPPARGKRRK